jgi:hypothetical protein
MAAALSWQPSKISKIENGRQTPSQADITAWCNVTDALAAADSLLAELAALESFYQQWRRQTRAGTRVPQRRWLGIESSVRHLRVFEPHFIPGLLQTAEYARIRLSEFGRLHSAPLDVDEAVAVRMHRQQVLHHPTKRFDFVIGENALRSGAAAPPAVMRGQLDRLLVTVTHSTVRLGVIPLGVLWPFHVDHGFWLFDKDFVLVETVTAELRLSQAEEIRTYVRVHAALSDVAAFGNDVRGLILDAINDLGDTRS